MPNHHIHVGSPTRLGALTVFPLWTETPSLSGIEWNPHAIAAEERASPFRRLPGQRGVGIGIGGRMLSIELFGSIAGLASRWDGIIAAARLDTSHAPALETPGWVARKLARRVAGETLVPDEIAGEGVTVGARLDSVRFSGLALHIDVEPIIHPRQLVHLTAVDTTHPLLED